ncbi:MAG: hypothetical protein FJZ01_23305 [Candidatus Sericytochromatia bacterium]|nr:hypothetical protein [Candidatus Tanganyikabacteria bacterium]
MKGPLLLRPCYHRSTHRIRAHVMLVLLAVNCLRVLEEQTGRSIAELRKIFNPLMASEVEDDGQPRWQRTELTAAQADVLDKLGIPRPPQTWAMWSDATKGEAMAR